MVRESVAAAAVLLALGAGAARAQGKEGASLLFAKGLNSKGAGAAGEALRGFVDLHTHPMAHLGFGGKLLHGAPDVGVLMPAGAIYDPRGVGLSGATCNQAPQRAATAAEALGSCYSSHAGHDFVKNKCGNHVRRLVLNGLEDGKHTNKPHDEDHPGGHPGFARWPRFDDILHQQMWVDWVKRAHQGGLRVMVALAVNSHTLAHGIEANEPRDDRASGDLQIDEMKRFVARHGDWMEIAYSPADLRRIVGTQDKLAVVLGVELDDIGNFSLSRIRPGVEAVRAEIRRLHGRGVRYVFPVHVVDNAFAGAAAYEDEFNRANCFHAGAWMALGCATPESGIGFKMGAGWDVFKTLKLGHCGGTAPVPNCATGHVNTRGLTAQGRIALDEMMRLGMLVDVDHASERTVEEILAHTGRHPGGRYPVVSGHNGLRGAGGSEASRTERQYREIAARTGLAGVGWGDSNARDWLRNARAVATTGVALALGSDINGLVKQPSPRPECRASPCVRYTAGFPRPASFGKTWDYNVDGVAHVGLFPDFLRDVEGLGGQSLVRQLFDGAEAFARTWERAEAVGRSPAVAAKARPAIRVEEALYGRNCNLPPDRADIRRWVAEQCDGEPACDYNFTWAPWGGDPSPSLCTKQIALRWNCGDGRRKEATVFHRQTPQVVPLSCSG